MNEGSELAWSTALAVLIEANNKSVGFKTEPTEANAWVFLSVLLC